MSGHRARVSALQTLVAGSPLPPIEVQRINNEFEEVFQAGRVRRIPRRLLLQVLHSTRALDSTLAGLIVLSGAAAPKSLGNALTSLKKTGLNGHKLAEPLRQLYQRDIVDRRNTYMHGAGTFPASTAEIAQLLDDMQSCCADVLLLW